MKRLTTKKTETNIIIQRNLNITGEHWLLWHILIKETKKWINIFMFFPAMTFMEMERKTKQGFVSLFIRMKNTLAKKGSTSSAAATPANSSSTPSTTSASASSKSAGFKVWIMLYLFIFILISWFFSDYFYYFDLNCS